MRTRKIVETNFALLVMVLFVVIAILVLAVMH
jgi:hypothetical protein